MKADIECEQVKQGNVKHQEPQITIYLLSGKP